MKKQVKHENIASEMNPLDKLQYFWSKKLWITDCYSVNLRNELFKNTPGEALVKDKPIKYKLAEIMKRY